MFHRFSVISLACKTNVNVDELVTIHRLGSVFNSLLLTLGPFMLYLFVVYNYLKGIGSTILIEIIFI